MKYCKKPVEVEAFQFGVDYMPEWFMLSPNVIWGNHTEIVSPFQHCPETMWCKIETLEGTMSASYGDFIIKGVKGEIYPCKEDIFYETYDKVDKDEKFWKLMLTMKSDTKGYYLEKEITEISMAEYELEDGYYKHIGHDGIYYTDNIPTEIKVVKPIWSELPRAICGYDHEPTKEELQQVYLKMNVALEEYVIEQHKQVEKEHIKKFNAIRNNYDMIKMGEVE